MSARVNDSEVPSLPDTESLRHSFRAEEEVCGLRVELGVRTQELLSPTGSARTELSRALRAGIRSRPIPVSRSLAIAEWESEGGTTK